MRDSAAETICARLCLLTRAAWRDGLPAPLPLPAVRRLIDSGALTGLVLCEAKGVGEERLERARALLSRSSDVYALLRKLRARGYRTLLPEDRDFPTALLSLGAQMPLFLFARGNPAVLGGRRIAVAGSRVVSLKTEAYARQVGERFAQEGITMVCGGAQGVDHAAQAGLLDAGGRLILVPAKPVEPLLAEARMQKALEEGRLLILCDTLPDETCRAARALRRNHVIYALGRAALVLAAREGKGGSWRGATDCLRGGFAPVFVPQDGETDAQDAAGCRALERLGAGTFSLASAAPLVEQCKFEEK